MKILCLSDLHRTSNFDIQQNNWIKDLIKEHIPDVVVITGDIFEASYQGNPYKGLSKLIGDIPVICTLGNHEFVDTTVEAVLKQYKGKYRPEKYDVHYLDIIGHYDISNVRFVGNVLWYDGSMSTVKDQRIETFADGRWLDRRIINFDFVSECNKNIQQIKDNLSDDENMMNVLCTHCVPHFSLNGHMCDFSSEFNAYSGVYDLLGMDGIKGKVNYNVCGHIHWRIIGIYIDDCCGVNCGNDYYSPFQYCIIEL